MPALRNILLLISIFRAWLVQQQSCPTCRADIPVESERAGAAARSAGTGYRQQQPNADVTREGGTANRGAGRPESSSSGPQVSSPGMSAGSAPYRTTRRPDTTQLNSDLRRTPNRSGHTRMVQLTKQLTQAIQEVGVVLEVLWFFIVGPLITICNLLLLSYVSDMGSCCVLLLRF